MALLSTPAPALRLSSVCGVFNIHNTHSGDRYQSVVSTAAGDLISSGSGDGLWLLGLLCRPSLHTFIRACCSHYAAQRALIRAVAAGCRLLVTNVLGGVCTVVCSAAVLRAAARICKLCPGAQTGDASPAQPAQPSPAQPSPAQPSHSCLLGTLCLSLSPSPTEQPRAAQPQLDNKGLSISHHMIWSQVNHQFPFRELSFRYEKCGKTFILNIYLYLKYMMIIHNK